MTVDTYVNKEAATVLAMSSVSACLMWRSAPIWKYEKCILQTLEIMVIHSKTIVKSDSNGYTFVGKEDGSTSYIYTDERRKVA